MPTLSATSATTTTGALLSSAEQQPQQQQRSSTAPKPRPSSAPPTATAPARYVEKEDFHLGKGMLVRAAYKAGAKYFRGVVHRVNLDGTYDVMYNGGELEFRVERRFIDSIETRAEWKTRLKLRADDKQKTKELVDAAVNGVAAKTRSSGTSGSGSGTNNGQNGNGKTAAAAVAAAADQGPLRHGVPWNCTVCRKPNNSGSESCRVCGTSKYYQLSMAASPKQG
jgi:hypothetical protein